MIENGPISTAVENILRSRPEVRQSLFSVVVTSVLHSCTDFSMVNSSDLDGFLGQGHSQEAKGECGDFIVAVQLLRLRRLVGWFFGNVAVGWRDLRPKSSLYL